MNIQGIKDSMKQEAQYGSCKKPQGYYPSYPTGAKGANVVKSCCQTTEKQEQQLEKWYDNFEVMKMFHISLRTLQTLRSNGKLPFAKLGNKCFYREQDLQHMMMESFRDSRVKFTDHDAQNGQHAPHKKKGGSPWR